MFGVHILRKASASQNGTRKVPVQDSKTIETQIMTQETWEIDWEKVYWAPGPRIKLDQDDNKLEIGLPIGVTTRTDFIVKEFTAPFGSPAVEKRSSINVQEHKLEKPRQKIVSRKG